MKLFRFALALALSAFAVSSASAQGYPNRPIRIVVPFPAGGGVDTITRIVSNKLSERIGQPVLVEHRPGAGGNLGADVVAKAAPDGYTLLMAINALSISASLYKTLPFDPHTAFTPVVQVAANPFVLVASQKLQASTVQEVIALARAKPGVLNYGSSGLGAPLHLYAEIFKHSAGIDIAHIPYRGDAPMLTALLAGDVQIGFMPAGTGIRQIQNGQVKGLGVTGRKRSPAVPDLPTMLEAGVKGLEEEAWYGLLAPAGTPRDIVMRLNREMIEVLKAPDVVERLRQGGNEPAGGTPEQLDAVYRADIKQFAKAIADAKIPKLD